MKPKRGSGAMRFATWVFLPAGVSGILLAVPPYFLLFEPATTLNTGDVRDERTVAGLERI